MLPHSFLGSNTVEFGWYEKRWGFTYFLLVFLWSVPAFSQETHQESTSTPAYKWLADFVRKHINGAEMIPTDEIPATEARVPLKDGEDLCLYSAKRQLRDVQTGKIRSDWHLYAIWLDLVPLGKTPPLRLWSFSIVQSNWRPFDRNEPYGFKVSIDNDPLVAIAFIDDGVLYFAEVDVHHGAPPRVSRTEPVETVNLQEFRTKRLPFTHGTSQFSIDGIGRDNGQWFVKISSASQQTMFVRVAPNSWADQPNTQPSVP